MGSIAQILRSAVELLITPFEGLGPLAVLVVVSLVTALATLGVVRVATPSHWITKARAQIAAAIYEVRLYLDNPVRVIKIQGRLLAYSGLYIASLMPALVLMTAPMGLIFLQLDVRYGHDPVPVGHPIVVSATLDGGVDDVTASPGDWGRITAPPVRDSESGTVYFRVVVDKPGTWPLEVRAGDTVAEKRIVAEAGVPVSPVRTRGIAMWWELTDEPPMGDGRIETVTVPHERNTLDVAGMPWWIFWLLLSTVIALVLRKPLRVEL